MLDLSVIIVTWNNQGLIEPCLQTVQANLADFDSQKVETIVVDNASTDGSQAAVSQGFPWVKLIHSQENLGFARGNNLAIAESQGQDLLLLNPDTELHAGAITALVNFLGDHPEAGAVGARLLNSDNSLQLSCYRTPTLARELWLLFHLDRFFPQFSGYNMETWDSTSSHEVDVLKGACLLIRRRALDEAGVFDSTYFMYSEEFDLCLRIRRQGWKDLVWTPRATVVHHEGQSTGQIQEKMFLQLYRSKVLFIRRHYGTQKAAAYKIILLAASLARLLLIPLVIFEGAERRERHLYLAKRYWQLVRNLPSM